MSEESIDDLKSGSTSLKADDLDGDEVTLTIAGYVVREFDQTDSKTGETYKRKKPVLSFEETEKTLVCNMTNMEAIAYAYKSRKFKDWVGKKITLFPTTVPVGNEIKPCIRVRVLKESGHKPRFIRDSENPAPLDDEIPF
jgi:hypothetical protein